MQTRHDPPNAPNHISSRLRWCAAACLCSLVLSACSAPRLAGRAESERLASSPCEQAYDQASDDEGRAGAHHPSIMRYLSAADARRQWLLVAANCPGRFAEGALRSARSAVAQHDLAVTLRIDASSSDDDGYGRPLAGRNAAIRGVGGGVLATMAAAEDRAGFALQVLASRSDGRESIAVGDGYRANASRLMSMAIGGADQRRKVYDVGALTTTHQIGIDATTRLAAPVPALVEIDCARDEMAAVMGTDGHERSLLAPLAVPDPSSGAGSDAGTRERSLLVLAGLTAGHALKAFDLGFPATDPAIFA
ncbi:MAG: hypothetical protein L0L38_00115 [Bifidobacterium mongoliense]|nr:hypothetical protein [Bifidobacterium mongoliense]MDN6719053.1 hypothetical protein [Bifidobacterium mongoliense]